MDTLPHRDPVWLRQKYEVEGLSTYDIGRLVGRDPKGVYTQLKRFGIPTRPRGLNLKKVSDYGGDNYVLNGGANRWVGRKHSETSKALMSFKARGPRPWLCSDRNGMADRTGATNPNYKDGSSPDRQRIYAHGKVRALLRYIYARDRYQCVRCGAVKTKPRSLHAHHIAPWGDTPALRFEPTNLVTLCRSCHSWVHSRKNAGREYIE